MHTHLVPFHDETIITYETPDGIFVPVKPLAERFGVSRQGQQAKLKARADLWGVQVILLPSQGGEQEMLCLPISRFAAWLFSLHSTKVKPEVRDALERYQREAADVLDRHFRQQHSEAEASLRQIIIEMEHRLTHAQAHLLSALPKWARMRELDAISMPWPFIAKRCSLTGEQYGLERRAMEDCGLFDRTERGHATQGEASLATIRRLEAELALAKDWPDLGAAVAGV